MAVVALFVALGGTTYAAISLPKNSVGAKQLKKNAVTGTKIKNGAVSTKKISKATLASLKGKTGPEGPPGATGTTGAQGPQGPGGSILTFDANASASPTSTTLGTALGDTWAAECVLNSGHAELLIFIKTSDGSWTWDLGQEVDNGSSTSVDAFHIAFPAGTYSASTEVGTDQGSTVPNDYELEDQGEQLKPVSGYLALHIAVLDTTAPSHTCHMTVNTIPETVTAPSALTPSGEATTSAAQLFGGR